MYKGFLCPVCKVSKLNVTFNTHEIPYFGEIMESVALCSGCHYRHTDVIVLQEKPPVKYTLNVEKEEDLDVRVIRSGQCKVEIPELGVVITPGAASDGFISNVEGILNRVEDAVSTSPKAGPLLDMIRKIKEGKEKITLIFDDPSGNSAIISDRAIKEEGRKGREDKEEVQEEEKVEER